ncbi:LOW QUALITY PROTEIN: hypothetical protein HID58_069118, partial [Brassica napus]
RSVSSLSSHPSHPPLSKARLCTSGDRRVAAPLAPPPVPSSIILGLAYGLAGGVCFEELVLGHGLRGGWVVCGLADLVSSGGGFSECFPSVVVSWVREVEVIRWRSKISNDNSRSLASVKF